MQTKEFENLMNGYPAQWAQFNDIPSLEDLKKEVKQNQKPIPEKTQTEINNFVYSEREKGTKERTIRRMVKRKWNITVV